MTSLISMNTIYALNAKKQKQNNPLQIEVSFLKEGKGSVAVNGEQLDYQLADFLARLTLLYDVPYNYIIPRKDLLPEESLRFFELDGTYMRYLLDGACSIGRNTRRDYEHDLNLIEKVYKAATKYNLMVRRNMKEEDANICKVYDEKAEQLADCVVYTGFLLHSDIVKDIKGIEIQGFDKEGKLLPIARLETIEDKVLLGIFPGILDKILFMTPKEALHMGISAGKEMTLRDRKTGRHTDITISLKYMQSEKTTSSKMKTLDIINLAKTMQEKFEQDKQFSSADFALQLITAGTDVAVDQLFDER